jgi:hypothetical protein
MAEKFSTGHAQAICTALRTAYTNGILCLFNGTQPADVNDTEGAGTLLARITLNSGAFTAGNATNGINFDAPSAGVLSKAVAEVWSGLGLANGTATWFRFYANAYTTGASTTAVRFDGAISTSASAELQLTVTAIVTGVPVVIDTFTLTPPRV